MASKPRKKGNRWEVVFKRVGVLDKPLYLFYETEALALEHSPRVDALLAKGIVPHEHQAPVQALTVGALLDRYERDAHPSQKDREVLRVVRRTRGAAALSAVTIQWADDWVTEMKRVNGAVPATIRAKVGAMGRAWHWGQRKEVITEQSNPFRATPITRKWMQNLWAALDGTPSGIGA